jgi:hypothetical protein
MDIHDEINSFLRGISSGVYFLHMDQIAFERITGNTRDRGGASGWLEISCDEIDNALYGVLCDVIGKYVDSMWTPKTVTNIKISPVRSLKRQIDAMFVYNDNKYCADLEGNVLSIWLE